MTPEDQKLFYKHTKELKGLQPSCLKFVERIIALEAFESALAERDKERVCGNCKYSSILEKNPNNIYEGNLYLCHNKISPIQWMQERASELGNPATTTRDCDGCNHWRSK